MGYRSEVFMAFRGRKDEIVGVLATWRMNYGHLDIKTIRDELTIGATGHDELLLTFHVHDWKWYDDYPNVQAGNALYSTAEELAEAEGSELSGAFIRLGEAHTDIEQKDFGGGYDLASISRAIHQEIESDTPRALDDYR